MGKPESKKARGPKPPVSKYAQKGSLEKECVKPEVPVVLTDHVFDVVGRTGFLNNTKGTHSSLILTEQGTTLLRQYCREPLP